MRLVLISILALTLSCATGVLPECDGGDCPEIGVNNVNNQNNQNNANNQNNQNNANNQNNQNNGLDVGGDGGDRDTGADTRDMREYLCLDRPPARNRVRKVLAAFPQNGAGIVEVLDLAEDGTLSLAGRNFQTGAMSGRNFVFTPDGSMGFGNRDDGAIVSIRFNPDGSSQIANAGFDSGVQIHGLVGVIGDRLFAWRTAAADQQGGLYQLPMNCVDGSLGPAQLLLGGEFIWNVNGRHENFLVSANSFGASVAGEPLHLYDPETNSYLDGIAPGGATAGFPTGLVTTHDGNYALLGENFFMGTPDRISIARINPTSLTAVGTLAVDEPVYLAASALNNLVISLPTLNTASGIKVIRYDPNNAATPFVVSTPHVPTPAITLPRGIAQVDRGDLAGLVLAAETQGIRIIRMNANQSVTSTFFPTGTTNADIVGKIGVQP